MDLNLLSIADALYRHLNVSKAAADLGLSQSAVSHALARLREHFKDPMFVRASKGVVSTELAKQLEPEIREILRRTEILLNGKKVFEPRVAQGRVTIATTDYFEMVVMPKLQPLLAREAPGMQISLRPTMGDVPKRELEEGKIDLCVAGFYENLPEGYFQSKLFTDSFDSAARVGHPSFGSRLTVDDFFSAKHALITLQGDFKDRITHRVGKKNREREIAYGSYSFTGLAWVLESSDLLLTAPKKLLDRYAASFKLQTWPCPVDLGKLDIRMVWHARTHEDPLMRWFRACLKQTCAGL